MGSAPDHLSGHRAWVTERTGGVSSPPFHSLNLGTRVPDAPANVEENERRVLDALGLAPPARADLVHGMRTESVDTPGLVPGVDALVTRRPDLPLALTVADCFPLAVIAGSWRGLAHCGWRGVAGGIVEELFRVLAELGADRAMARAWIGPGIGVCCYEVGSEVALSFPEGAVREVGADPGSEDPSPRIHLDLAAEIVRRLRDHGLTGDAIASAGLCTACNTDRFFSHRAEGPTGRMSAYLV